MNNVPSIRLFVPAPLVRGGEVVCDKGQVNYLLNVLRLDEGAEIAVFNGVDGEWRALLRRQGKRAVALELGDLIREQTVGPDLHYLFAPIKRSRLDYMVQKAVELGVSRLSPVFTEYCQMGRVNLDRMRSNSIEAAEQCGILQIPEIDKPVKLIDLIGKWDKTRALVFCDEGCDKDLEACAPLSVLERLSGQPVAVLIGPEGGFSSEERLMLRSEPFVTPLSLGPRIMRADTAAVAALALLNATVGDW